MFLFAAKVYASIRSGSLAIIASTLDSLLDLLSGFILWFTAFSMQTANPYHYPIGKKRMQPLVSPVIFSSSFIPTSFEISQYCSRGDIWFRLQQLTYPCITKLSGSWIDSSTTSSSLFSLFSTLLILGRSFEAYWQPCDLSRMFPFSWMYRPWGLFTYSIFCGWISCASTHEWI